MYQYLLLFVFDILLFSSNSSLYNLYFSISRFFFCVVYYFFLFISVCLVYFSLSRSVVSILFIFYVLVHCRYTLCVFIDRSCCVSGVVMSLVGIFFISSLLLSVLE